jgi:hypothetical protein
MQKTLSKINPVTLGLCAAGSVTIAYVNFHGGGCVEVSTNGNVGGTLRSVQANPTCRFPGR